MIFSSVLFPEPFAPISPQECPSGTSNATSRSAQKSSARDRRSRRIRSFRLEGRSWTTRNRFETWSTEMADSATSQLLGKVAGAPVEGAPREVQEDRRDGSNGHESDGVPAEPRCGELGEGLLASPPVQRPLEA